MKNFLRAILFTTASFALLAAVMFLYTGHSTIRTMAPALSSSPLLIIDPGHGGEDGGAVSLTGESESHINLAVGKRLDMILGLAGMPVLMLREEDVSLHSVDSLTLRQKKVSDLHNRAAMVEEQENAVLLSIHQNSYPDGRYSGAQVFFAPTNGSQAFAQTMQEILRQSLDPDNGRECKPIPDTIYLMNHISCPGVLVECGFLTNPAEERLLRDEAYQTKIAVAMAACWLQYCNT